MDKASATETVNSGLNPGKVKPKTIKIDIHNFFAWRSGLKNQGEEDSTVCGRQLVV